MHVVVPSLPESITGDICPGRQLAKVCDCFSVRVDHGLLHSGSCGASPEALFAMTDTVRSVKTWQGRHGDKICAIEPMCVSLVSARVHVRIHTHIRTKS